MQLNTHPREKVRAIYISDVHIGSSYCQCRKLLEFLANYEFEELYLLGDIFDGDELKKKIKWTEEYGMFMSYLVANSKKTKITYIPGNHDSFLEPFTGNCINALCIEHNSIIENNGNKILLTHGHNIEDYIDVKTWKRSIGLLGYCVLKKLKYIAYNIGLEKLITNISRYINGYAEDYISQFEYYCSVIARESHCQVIIAGHVHCPASKNIDGIQYYNCGDWTQNCTGLIEDLDGNFKIQKYSDLQ